MASRKSFIRVAQALRLTSASHDTIVAVGLALAADNPRFNLDKFVNEAEKTTFTDCEYRGPDSMRIDLNG